MRPRALLAPLALIGLLFSGCGGSGGDGEKKPVEAITLAPATARLVPGASQSFTAVLDGSYQPVTWSVAASTNGASSGTVNQSGRYTAPAVSGTYTVRATLKRDATKSGSATVVVDSGVAVKVSGAANVGVGKGSAYAAAVTGNTDTRVTWKASAGSISSAGIFTAPATVGDVTITATSVADPGKSGTLRVHVAEPIVAVAPAAGSLAIPGSRLRFTALVDGVTSTNVTWTASAGTIDATGKWIAPTGAGTATITARRKDDTTKTASVTAETVANVAVVMAVENRGTIEFSLNPAQAPNTSANYVSLINESFYDGIIVHRYEPGFVVQWGDPLTKTLPLDDPSIGTGGPGYTIPFETNSLKNVKYSLAMARSSDRNSGGSQVYVNLANNASLDGNYVVFGAVRSGQSVVDALRRGDRITSIRVRKP